MRREVEGKDERRKILGWEGGGKEERVGGRERGESKGNRNRKGGEGKKGRSDEGKGRKIKGGRREGGRERK